MALRNSASAGALWAGDGVLGFGSDGEGAVRITLYIHGKAGGVGAAGTGGADGADAGRLPTLYQPQICDRRDQCHGSTAAGGVCDARLSQHTPLDTVWRVLYVS